VYQQSFHDYCLGGLPAELLPGRIKGMDGLGRTNQSGVILGGHYAALGMGNGINRFALLASGG